MANLLKKCVIITMLLSVGNFTFADRGIGKKARLKTLLNINTNASTSLKTSIALNIKSGLAYKGSISSSNKSTGLMQNSSYITYQKGNTTYIIPYKQKVTMPEIKQGYTGLKLIIRSKN
jgi:LysM repeat protein